MRKRIAFLAGAISFDNQNRVVTGVLKRAAELNLDVYIFTCFVNYDESEENKIGAFRIMELPDFHTFDGVIVMKNSIQYDKASDTLIKKILNSRILAVSIDENVDGMHNVGISDYDSQKRIVEHLLEKHHLTKVNYVCGILQGKEGVARYQAYRDAMEEHGIPVSNSQIYFGNYSRESGRKAVEYFIKYDMPEAIVFANDAMAIGAMERLRQKGYKIPEDILITGFDNDELSEFCVPSLTTVDRMQENLGEAAVNLLFDRQPDSCAQITTKILYRESCGCSEQTTKTKEDLRVEYQNKCMIYEEALDALKSMELDLTGLESVEELCLRLGKYVLRSDMKNFYMCLCDDKELFAFHDDRKTNIREQPICDHYTKTVRIPIAYHNGAFTSFERFPSKEVLPPEIRKESKKTFYVVTPIYYQKVCYGYCVSEESTFALKSELSYLWTVNIGMALENIRKWRWINQMNEKINRMWKYDMLTQVLNRRGFFYSADVMIEQIKQEKKKAFVIFLDIDGLKSVNDGIGHEAGDAFICEMAEVIRKAVPKDCLIMRYGGDEFVIFGSCETAQRMRRIIQRIRDLMEKENQKENRSYQLSASIGGSLHTADEVENLNQLIEAADKRMYIEKRKKHTRR